MAVRVSGCCKYNCAEGYLAQNMRVEWPVYTWTGVLEPLNEWDRWVPHWRGPTNPTTMSCEWIRYVKEGLACQIWRRWNGAITQQSTWAILIGTGTKGAIYELFQATPENCSTPKELPLVSEFGFTGGEHPPPTMTVRRD